jgi:hypothetical protein
MFSVGERNDFLDLVRGSMHSSLSGGSGEGAYVVPLILKSDSVVEEPNPVYDTLRCIHPSKGTFGERNDFLDLVRGSMHASLSGGSGEGAYVVPLILKSDSVVEEPNPVYDTLRCIHPSKGTFVRDPPLLNPQDRRAHLGRGSFGTLIRAKLVPVSGVTATNIPNNASYALKCISTLIVEGANTRAIPIEDIAKEAHILQQLDHPSIVKYVESNHDEANHLYFIVMEFVDGMTLSKKVDCNPKPSENDIFNWLKQIASALAYLHKGRILHRDLKPSNVLVSLNGADIKLCDFGLAYNARFGTDGVSFCVGTPKYFSYEKIAGLSYENGCDDMWAVGCILVELLTQQRLECALQQPEHWRYSDPKWPAERVTAYRKDMLQLAAEVSPFLGGEILPGLLRLCPVGRGDPTSGGAHNIRNRTTAAELLQALEAAEPGVKERHCELQGPVITALQARTAAEPELSEQDMSMIARITAADLLILLARAAAEPGKVSALQEQSRHEVMCDSEVLEMVKKGKIFLKVHIHSKNILMCHIHIFIALQP